jgi:hypothetical protein
MRLRAARNGARGGDTLRLNDRQCSSTRVRIVFSGVRGMNGWLILSFNVLPLLLAFADVSTEMDIVDVFQLKWVFQLRTSTETT